MNLLQKRVNLISECHKEFNQSKAFDIAILSGFALFAVIYTLGRWKGLTPFIFLDSDASYISTYAAALDSPQAFTHDYFLSTPGRASSYFEILIPIIRLLKKIVGGYGNAFIFLLPITIFLKLLGFYVLGKQLFHRKWVGLLLALASYPIVYSGAWDYWGIRNDALPRNLFEVFFPWLILAIFNWINQPKRWFLLGGLFGLLMYVHSISAGVTFLSASIIYLVCSKRQFLKRVGDVSFSGLIFLVVSLPFFYFSEVFQTSSATVPIPYTEALNILNEIYGETHFQTIRVFGKVLVQLTLSGIIPLAIMAFLFYLIVQKRNHCQQIKIVAVWVISIVFISVFLPAMEKYVDQWLQLSTIQMMLIRGLRYMPPLLLLFSFLVFFGNFSKLENNSLVINNVLGSILIITTIGLMIHFNPQDKYFSDEIRCLSSGRLTCPTQQELDAVDIIQALDTFTTSNDTILSIPPLDVKFNTAIRFQALRCLGYSDSDMTRLNRDPGLQIQIARALDPWLALETIETKSNLQSYIALSKNVKVNFLIVSLDTFSSTELSAVEVIYKNQNYALIKIP